MNKPITDYLNDNNVQAFLQVIRTGEGTLGDNGYRTLYGGSLFDSFNDHPRRKITAGRWTSTAAGAYQFLARTWDALVRQYHFSDFGPRNQDLGALALIRGRKALEDVVNGNIVSAIKKCNREWASLPESPYGQPTMTMVKALEVYKNNGGLLQEREQPMEVKKETTMAPLLAAVIPALMQVVPDLIRVFGGGEQSAKNATAAEIVIAAAKDATGAFNEQDLIEKLESKDPEVIQAVQAAVRSVWYEISVDTGGVAEARKANVETKKFWTQPAIWITTLLLPLVYMTVMSVLQIGGISEATFNSEIQAMVVAAIISGVLSGITGFWLGTSFSSDRKTEMLVKR